HFRWCAGSRPDGTSSTWQRVYLHRYACPLQRRSCATGSLTPWVRSFGVLIIFEGSNARREAIMKGKAPQVSSKESQKQRVTRKVAALPKGAKEVLRKGAKAKTVFLSPSQPHSKSFGR